MWCMCVNSVVVVNQWQQILKMGFESGIINSLTPTRLMYNKYNMLQVSAVYRERYDIYGGCNCGVLING
jgi:hypothetical protein